MPYKSNDEETYLRDQLNRLQREYQVAAQPYVDRLVYIESLKSPQSFTLLTSAEFAAACAESWKRFETPVNPE